MAGGDRVIVAGDDLSDRLDEALEGNQLSLVLDSVGGPAVAELAYRLRFRGKIITYGALGDQSTLLSVRRDLIYREITHRGSG